MTRLAELLRLSPLERAYLFSLAIDETGMVSAVVPEFGILASGKIAAESIDREILLALRAHRTIKTSIYASIVHGTIDTLKPHLDETHCPIGIWLHDELATGQRSEAIYSRASRIHAAFHREIDHVIDAACTGNRLDAERLLLAPGRYSVASAALERAFGEWRETLSAS